MENLTLNEKTKIVSMLLEHYTIDDAAANVIATATTDSNEARVELTLKVLSNMGKPKSITCNESVGPFGTVLITRLSNKLYLIKAVKEATRWSLKDCKNFVNDIVTNIGIGTAAQYLEHKYIFDPFNIGPKEKITVPQWEIIVTRMNAMCKDNFVSFEWRFV